MHLGRGLRGLDPCPFSSLTKLCPQYLYQASKSQYIIIFWIIKCFWKPKNRIYVKTILFCVCRIILDLAILSVLLWVLCIKSFEMLLCCDKEFMCLLVFPFVETSSKNRKCNGSYINQYDLFSAVFFYWGFLFVCKTMKNLKTAWIISYIYFGFVVWL